MRLLLVALVGCVVPADDVDPETGPLVEQVCDCPPPPPAVRVVTTAAECWEVCPDGPRRLSREVPIGAVYTVERCLDGVCSAPYAGSGWGREGSTVWVDCACLPDESAVWRWVEVGP